MGRPLGPNLSGQKFGRLTVLERSERKAKGTAYWICLCECGNQKTVCSTTLRKGKLPSCGCAVGSWVATHGQTGTRIFKTWDSMKQRCLNPKSALYPRYGGRGITICEKWLNSFEAFHADMGEPLAGQSIDRINNDGNYEPGNCRWATRSQQQRNKSVTRMLEWNGQVRPIKDWAEDVNISAPTISARLARGWSVEKTITTPKGNYRPQRLNNNPAAVAA